MRQLHGRASFWLAAALVSACVTSAGAQSTTPLDTTQRGGWIFVPAVSFSGTADDNVLLAGQGQQPPSDYVTGIGPSGTLDYNGRRLKVSGIYAGSFVLYRTLSELNSLDQNGRIGFTYRTTPRVTISAGQSFSTAPTTDTVQLIAVPFRRIGNTIGATTASVNARLTARTTVQGDYSLRIVSFNTAGLQFIAFPGGHEHYGAGQVDHVLSTHWSVGGVADVRRVVIAGGVEPVMVYHWAGTTEYHLTDMVSFHGSMGVSRLGSIASRPARVGLAWSAGTSARLQYATLSAGYERSVVPSFGFGGTYQNKEFDATVRGPFARNRAYWQGAVAWRWNDPLIIGPPSRRSTWLTGSLGYMVFPWIRVEGYYSRSQQITNFETAINRNRLGFQVVTSKPFRLAH